MGAAVLCTTLVPAVVTAAPAAAAQNSTPDIPKTFEGTIKVEQSHPQQSNLQGEGIFSAYDATATFSNLTFSKGKEGPYTLVDGKVAYSGFDVDQSVPNGKFGQCQATYHFALSPSAPLFGDLGGFSESGGNWHVELQLGISVVGAITNSTNCEPDNAGAGTLWGPPSSPKISFPVSAEGSFDPSTGIITFHDKTSYAYLGGQETNDVSGTLNGGLQIYLTEKGKKVNVTDEKTDVTVGQQIHLLAQFSDGSQPELAGNGWSGMTDTNAIKDYEFENELGKVRYLDQADLTSPDLTFYWTKDTTNDPEPLIVEVEGKNKRTGDEESAETFFEIEAPEVASFAALTCGPGVNVIETVGGLKPPDLILGYNSRASCVDTPGIRWNITVYGSQSDKGTVALTQIATVDVEHNGTPCTAGKVRLDGTKVISDNGAIYASGTLANGEQWHPDLSDSPHVPLRRGGTWSANENFSDYILFKPDLPDSKYVALQELSPWFFRASAALEGTEWFTKTYENPPGGLSSAPATTPPQWTGTVTAHALTGC